VEFASSRPSIVLQLNRLASGLLHATPGFAAALLLGLAVLYWSRSDSDLAGPFLGATATFTLLLAGRWAYEDVRAKRTAERQRGAGGNSARYIQMISFVIAPGQLDAARGKAGILAAIEQADDTLYGLDGFEHLRIVVSPSGDGPAQVVVETSWSGREGLATYDEARKRLLEIVNVHRGEVEDDGDSGQAQVRDMEVIRDTKDAGFQLSVTAFAGIVGGFLIGGFMLGMTPNLFWGGSTTTVTPAATGAAPAAAAGAPTVTTTDNKFSQTTLKGEAGKEFSVALTNRGKVPHNINFLDKKGGSPLTPGSTSKIISGGASGTLTFTPAAAGTYYFQCDVHPGEMFGTFTVS
jgi:plastocyanin